MTKEEAFDRFWKSDDTVVPGALKEAFREVFYAGHDAGETSYWQKMKDSGEFDET